MLAIHPTAGGDGFAALGDSGSAVLGQTKDHGGLDFVGLLVSGLFGANPTKMKTFWVIKYLNIYSINK